MADCQLAIAKMNKAAVDGNHEYKLFVNQVHPAVKSLMELYETKNITLRGLNMEKTVRYDRGITAGLT